MPVEWSMEPYVRELAEQFQAALDQIQHDFARRLEGWLNDLTDTPLPDDWHVDLDLLIQDSLATGVEMGEDLIEHLRSELTEIYAQQQAVIDSGTAIDPTIAREQRIATHVRLERDEQGEVTVKVYVANWWSLGLQPVLYSYVIGQATGDAITTNELVGNSPGETLSQVSYNHLATYLYQMVNLSGLSYDEALEQLQNAIRWVQQTDQRHGYEVRADRFDLDPPLPDYVKQAPPAQFARAQEVKQEVGAASDVPATNDVADQSKQPTPKKELDEKEKIIRKAEMIVWALDTRLHFTEAQKRELQQYYEHVLSTGQTDGMPAFFRQLLDEQYQQKLQCQNGPSIGADTRTDEERAAAQDKMRTYILSDKVAKGEPMTPEERAEYERRMHALAIDTRLKYADEHGWLAATINPAFAGTGNFDDFVFALAGFGGVPSLEPKPGTSNVQTVGEPPVQWPSAFGGFVANESPTNNTGIQRGRFYWMEDSPHMKEHAREYEAAGMGARSHVVSHKPQVPILEMQMPNGSMRIVKFDGVEDNVFIDRKWSITRYPRTKDQLIRQSEALRQNGYTGRLEVPNESQANAARRLLSRLGITNIGVKVSK